MGQLQRDTAEEGVMHRTYYDILEVSSSASQSVISAAYRALSKKYHPDKNNGDKHSEEMMAKINIAYGVLSDPIKRNFYDEEIGLSKSESNLISKQQPVPKKEESKLEQKAHRQQTSSSNSIGTLFWLITIGIFLVLILIAILDDNSIEQDIKLQVEEAKMRWQEAERKWQEAENILIGKGSSQNYLKALEEYKHIAENKFFSDRRAEKRIAEIYFFGLGQEKDYAKALEWYKKTYGSESEFMIGLMYYEGLGVKKDWITAYYYFNKAQTDNIELLNEYSNPLIKEEQNKLIEANQARGEVKIDRYGYINGRFKTAARIKKVFLDKTLSVDEINKAQNLRIED